MLDEELLCGFGNCHQQMIMMCERLLPQWKVFLGDLSGCAVLKEGWWPVYASTIGYFNPRRVHTTSRQSSVIQSSLVPAASTDKLLPSSLDYCYVICSIDTMFGFELSPAFSCIRDLEFPPKAGGLQRRSCHLLLGNSLGSIFTTDSTDRWMTTCQCANVAIYVWCNLLAQPRMC